MNFKYTFDKVVVCGPSNSGKTTVAVALATRLGFLFREGDDYHPESNVEKMKSGTPLTDEDRLPWLRRLRKLLESDDAIVMTCSALKKQYRSMLTLRGMIFIFLDVDPSCLQQRAAKRKGHFMPASLLDSQLATLEPPQCDREGLPNARVLGVKVNCSHSAEDVLNLATEALRPFAGCSSAWLP